MPKTNIILAIPEPGRVELKERPYPTIVPGFSLVKVEIAPVCIEHQVYRDHTMEWHSDADNQGHEGVGTIVETRPGSTFAVGDRVVIYQGNSCQECFVCERGLSPSHCLSIPYEDIAGDQDPGRTLEALGGGQTIDAPGGLMAIQNDCGSDSGGFGFSQFRIAPNHMLQKIPEDLPFRYAALANCSLGCTYTAFEECNIGIDDWVVVAGVGFIGFGAIINAKYRGANVIVLGRNPFRMAQATKMGADHIVDPDDPDWLEQIHALTGRLRGADLVVEASGYPYYQRRALDAVRRFGTMWMYGFLVDNYETFPMHFLDDIHNRSIRLSGSHDVYFNHREGVVRMLSNPRVQAMADHMITHEYNMSQGVEAFEAALSKQAGKIYLYPHENCPAPGLSPSLQELIDSGAAPMSRFGLEGKRALITGGTAGIGRAVAQRFVDEGADVIIVGRRADGTAIADEIGAHFIECDVTSEAAVTDLLRAAVEVLGGLDALVLNAGIDPGMAPMADYGTSAFEQNLDVNLRHVWWCLAHGAAHLTDGASIITTSSTVAAYKVPNVSAYAAIKEAVVSLTKSAALELAHRGIRANAVLPGTTLSEMTPADHWEIPVMETMLPMGRHATASEDLVGLYQFLASDESGYITGQAIAADGGMTLGMSYGTLRALGAPADVMSPSTTTQHRPNSK